MVLLDLEDVWTEVLPGLPLPAGAANFNVEPPSSWDFGELCTLALLLPMVRHLQQGSWCRI